MRLLGAMSAVLALGVGVARAQPLVEPFDSVSSLPVAGWLTQNNSSPIGSTGWFQGTPSTFPAQATAGYIAADYRNVLNLGTISNWLVTPTLNLNNGDAIQFWTRTVSPSAYADRLQVRLSTAGNSAVVGSDPLSVGTFTTLLLDINPEYAIGASGYPTGWTQYTIVISGLSGPSTGRIAFRYFVEHGGESGSQSDYIGIDSVEFTPGGVATGRCCIAATGQCVEATSPTCANVGGVFAGAGTVCAGFNCPQPPSGACCLASGGCQVLPTTVCLSAGGLFRGEGSPCSSAACPLVFSYLGKPLEVPDGSGSSGCGVTVYAEVFVPMSFPIASVEAAFILDHPWQGDLKVKLTKVGGPTVVLVDRPDWPADEYGFPADDFGMLATVPPRYFRVGSAAPVTYDSPTIAFPGTPQVSGAWKAEQSLAPFSGMDTLGRWKLELSDCAGGEFGDLMRFALIITPPAGTAPCYANCDGSNGVSVLTANDFQCFLNLFAQGDLRANCDGSLGVPQLTANDFSCFLDRFAGGCQ